MFSKFCLGQLAALPWSDTTPSSETTVIAQQLAKLNDLGFLTINSQPAVDGARSDDRVHGWGPPNGYVYQKVRASSAGLVLGRGELMYYMNFQAYLEFFVSPELLELLIPHIERDINITYYVINHRGDLRTNTHSDGPNAVTWGVFPGKEIVQPTIVEAISFMAWKVGCMRLLRCDWYLLTEIQDEAYELGRQWATFYEPESPSRKLIDEVMTTYYLVNVVHNDFKKADAIFQPFYKAGAEYAAKHAALNGTAN